MIRALLIAATFCLVASTDVLACDRSYSHYSSHHSSHYSDSYYGDSYYGDTHRVSHRAATMRLINTGHVRTRRNIYADVFGVRRVITVINGRLPVVTQKNNRLTLDYKYNYVYDSTYKSGVSYFYGTTVAGSGYGVPSAVKNYGVKVPKTTRSGISGVSALNRPGDGNRKANLGTYLPNNTVESPDRPSDREIDLLLR